MQEDLEQIDSEQEQADLPRVEAQQVDEQIVEGQEAQGSSEQGEPEAAMSPPEPTPPAPQKERGHTHTAFLEALEAHAQALGLKTLTQTSFVQFLEPGTGHKLYVGRTARDTTPVRIETTLPVLDRVAGATAPEKENGKIAAVLPPEMDVVMQVMQILASKEMGPIRAAKRLSKPVEK